MGNTKVFSCGFIMPEEVGSLETAVETAEVDVEKRRETVYLPNLTEVEEVVLEVLVAFRFYHRFTTRIDKNMGGDN